jgi:hypothetical protein
MALEDLIGGLYQFNMGLPLQYANPYFGFLNNQAGNMTSLGNQYQSNIGSLGGQAIGGSASLGNSSMGLYGNLAGQQSQMYQAELPMQMEMAKYNSLAPALSGLLGQFGGGGMGGMNISPISMNFNRPDVMGGYQGAVDNAYKNFGNTTNQAYGQAADAYGRARGGADEIGNQFQGQWQNLQDRVFPKQASEAPQSPGMSPGAAFPKPGRQNNSGGMMYGSSPGQQGSFGQPGYAHRAFQSRY